MSFGSYHRGRWELRSRLITSDAQHRTPTVTQSDEPWSPLPSCRRLGLQMQNSAMQNHTTQGCLELVLAQSNWSTWHQLFECARRERGKRDRKPSKEREKAGRQKDIEWHVQLLLHSSGKPLGIILLSNCNQMIISIALHICHLQS